MRGSTLFETIAARLLARQGIGLIWQLHLRATASHLSGNWLAAAALIGIADAAERVGASRQVGMTQTPAPAVHRDSFGFGGLHEEKPIRLGSPLRGQSEDPDQRVEHHSVARRGIGVSSERGVTTV
jgi:hypothetical protein